MESFRVKDERYNDSKNQRVFPYFLEWHEAHINGFTDLGEAFGADMQSMWHIEKKDLFSMLSKKIELEIER